MGHYKRAITKGSIFRDNIFSLLVLLIIVCCFGAWVRINNQWQTKAVKVTATVTGIQDSDKGSLAVIQWQANGRAYSRTTGRISEEIGDEQEVRYLPDEPERALTFQEVDGEAARIIGMPAMVAFGLVALLVAWMNSPWGPRRDDDHVVVAEVTKRD